jgi:hypothetical protein
MAITLDTAAAAYRGTGATSHTFSFTVGANTNKGLCLFLHVFDGDRATGVTYAGSAMTQVNKVKQGSSADYGYIYYLNAPTAGANNFVVSVSPSTRISWAASSYYNVKQTVQPEANNTAGGGGTSATVATISVTDNAFIVYGYIHNAGATDSYTNVTQRAVDASNGTTGIGDALQVTAGSLSQAANWTGTQQYAANALAIAPFVATGPNNLKSYNTNLKANIKSVNTNLIANVKSVNTNV